MIEPISDGELDQLRQRVGSAHLSGGVLSGVIARIDVDTARLAKFGALLRVARDSLDRIYDNGDMTGSDLKLIGDIIDRIDQELDQTLPIKIPT